MWIISLYFDQKSKTEAYPINLSAAFLSVIHQKFSNQGAGPGEPANPPGTHATRYMIDAGLMSVEDAFDIYIFRFMVIGFLLIGTGGYSIYRKLEDVVKATGELKKLTEGLGRAAWTQT